MKVDDCLGDVLELLLGIFFTQCLVDLEVGKESAFFHVFQDQVDMLSVIKVAVQLKNIVIVAEYLDSYLLQELVHH